MTSIYDLKPRFQALLRPLIRGLASAGITPNMVTLAALAGSAAVGLAARESLLWLFPIWLFTRMALNAIDGMMARELNLASRLGAVLNEMGDVLADLALYLPLAWIHEPSLWAVIAFAIGAVLTEFSGVLAQALGAGRRYDGPMGKSDRAFVVGALTLATFFVPRLFAAWAGIFWLAAAVEAVTCANRLAKAVGA